MDDRKIDSWREYKDLIDDHAAQSFRISGKDKGSVTPILYRGQADSAWKLETTLERRKISHYTFRNYMMRCISARRLISNIEPRQIPFDEECLATTYSAISMRMPNYEYMAFLRHHGFPSPLLDWTESPYVAAFFAFFEQQKGVDSVAVYEFQEYSGGGKVFSHEKPTIHVQGPFASVHARHAAQQCCYTTCMKSQGVDEAIFCPHESAFATPAVHSLTQDVLQKIILPVSERRTAMADLRKMNITPYTLFGSLDSLIGTVSERLFPI